jgi:hypothetical protein
MQLLLSGILTLKLKVFKFDQERFIADTMALKRFYMQNLAKI